MYRYSRWSIRKLIPGVRDGSTAGEIFWVRHKKGFKTGVKGKVAAG
jgi:hypothetical protein